MFTTELYAAIKDGKQVWKSTDNGWSWSYLCDFPVLIYYSTIVLSVASNGILYCVGWWEEEVNLYTWNGVSWDSEDIKSIFSPTPTYDYMYTMNMQVVDNNDIYVLVYFDDSSGYMYPAVARRYFGVWSVVFDARGDPRFTGNDPSTFYVVSPTEIYFNTSDSYYLCMWDGFDIILDTTIMNLGYGMYVTNENGETYVFYKDLDGGLPYLFVKKGTINNWTLAAPVIDSSAYEIDVFLTHL